jgi:excisionase family DNA binding protein
MSTIEIVLKHLIPALDAIRRELEKCEEVNPPSFPIPESPRTTVLEIIKAPSPKKHLLNIDEASERLSISKPALYRFTSQRRIPFYKIGKRVLFTEEKLQEWIDQHYVDMD